MAQDPLSCAFLFLVERILPSRLSSPIDAGDGNLSIPIVDRAGCFSLFSFRENATKICTNF